MSRPHVELALLLAALLASGAAGAKTSDRNQPIDIDADKQDCSFADSGPCLFTGNVKIVQGTLNITAAKADVRQGGGDIQRVLLSGGPVRMSQQLDDGGKIDARASNVDYDLPKDTVVFTGNVELTQAGRGSMSGQRIVYNMRTGQVQSGGEGAGRTRTRLLPKNAAPQGTN